MGTPWKYFKPVLLLYTWNKRHVIFFFFIFILHYKQTKNTKIRGGYGSRGKRRKSIGIIGKEGRLKGES